MHFISDKIKFILRNVVKFGGTSLSHMYNIFIIYDNFYYIAERKEIPSWIFISEIKSFLFLILYIKWVEELFTDELLVFHILTLDSSHITILLAFGIVGSIHNEMRPLHLHLLFPDLGELTEYKGILLELMPTLPWLTIIQLYMDVATKYRNTLPSPKMSLSQLSPNYFPEKACGLSRVSESWENTWVMSRRENYLKQK